MEGLPRSRLIYLDLPTWIYLPESRLLYMVLPTWICRSSDVSCRSIAASKARTHPRVTLGPRTASPSARRVRSWALQWGSWDRDRRTTLRGRREADEWV